MTLYLGTELVANSVTVPYNWVGTKAEYEALETINDEWVYYVTDDFSTLDILQTIYPVGSIYLTFNNTCPLSALFGTWQIVGTDKVLQGAGTRGSVGTTLNESLPNITGSFTGARLGASTPTTDGCFTGTTGSTQGSSTDSSFRSISISFNANNSSSTYQDNAPVQPDAILVNIFKRIA